MFERFEMAPPDPILGLTEAFRADARADKINLGVGIFQDEHGQTPTLESVRAAEQRLLDTNAPKTYLPIPGSVRFGQSVRGLLFGSDSPLEAAQRAVTAQTPGGTGALRVAVDLLHTHAPGARMWVSNPTWANHRQILDAAGMATCTYRYFDAQSSGLDEAGMWEDLAAAKPGDVVLLHGCCHNPTGVDPTLATWQALAQFCRERDLLPLIDLAYQGFGDGLEEDAAGLRALLDEVPEALIASSYSKNFGLYNERVGALTLIAADREGAQRAFSQMKIAIRTHYSNPPRHGGAIVETILGDEDLRALWQTELDSMRQRLLHTRQALVAGLSEAGLGHRFDFLRRQKGMFSFSGIAPDQVDRLREEHGIYMVRSGRINVAGITAENLPRLCSAIAHVVA